MAAVVLCGIMHAGGRYFYCEALGLALSDPCARPAAHGSSECPFTAVEPDRSDCCTVVVFRAMPDSAAAERSRVPPAPVVAVLPASIRAEEGAALRDDRSLRIALGRWRVPRKPPGEARARLMVFLI